MEADGICLRRRQKNRAAEKRQPLILQIFIERLTRRTINDRAIVIADLLASLLELLKLPAGINMLILELPGDDLILIDDTLLHNSDIPLHELYLLMLVVQRSVHVASVNQRLQKHPFLRLLYLYDAFKLLLEFFQHSVPFLCPALPDFGCYLYYSRHCGNFPDLFWKKQNNPAEAIASAGLLLNGAADEARTRYLHLGKVALYQMSYGRIKNHRR